MARTLPREVSIVEDPRDRTCLGVKDGLVREVLRDRAVQRGFGLNQCQEHLNQTSQRVGATMRQGSVDLGRYEQQGVRC